MEVEMCTETPPVYSEIVDRGSTAITEDHLKLMKQFFKTEPKSRQTLTKEDCMSIRATKAVTVTEFCTLSVNERIGTELKTQSLEIKMVYEEEAQKAKKILEDIFHVNATRNDLERCCETLREIYPKSRCVTNTSYSDHTVTTVNNKIQNSSSGKVQFSYEVQVTTPNGVILVRTRNTAGEVYTDVRMPPIPELSIDDSNSDICMFGGISSPEVRDGTRVPVITLKTFIVRSGAWYTSDVYNFGIRLFDVKKEFCAKFIVTNPETANTVEEFHVINRDTFITKLDQIKNGFGVTPNYSGTGRLEELGMSALEKMKPSAIKIELYEFVPKEKTATSTSSLYQNDCVETDGACFVEPSAPSLYYMTDRGEYVGIDRNKTIPSVHPQLIPRDPRYLIRSPTDPLPSTPTTVIRTSASCRDTPDSSANTTASPLSQIGLGRLTKGSPSNQTYNKIYKTVKTTPCQIIYVELFVCPKTILTN